MDDYKTKVYNALKGELGESFNRTYEEFDSLLTSDPSYSKKVYSALKGELGNSFSKSEDEFNSLLFGTETNVSIPESSLIAYEHNNPGNLMYVGQEGAIQGEPKEGGGYWAKFETPDSGFQGLKNDIQIKQSGRSASGLKPESTVAELINVYTPPTENNTSGYIDNITKALGVTPDTPIKDIDTDSIAREIAKIESGTKINVQQPKSEKTLQDKVAQTPEERTIYENAAYDVDKKYAEMGGMTPPQKMSEFNKRSKEINSKYENQVLFADTQEDLNKLNQQYKEDITAISNELGLQVTDDGSVKPFDVEIENYLGYMENFLRINAKKFAKEPDSFLNDLSDRLAGGFSSFTANMVDLAGFLTGANYFEGYKNLSEGQRLRAEQFRDQSQRYDGDIQQLVSEGNIGQATGLALMSSVESLPAMIPMFVAPEYGLYVMGAGAAMQQYRNIENEDIPKWQKILDAVANGANEAVWEKAITVPILAKSKQAMLSLGKRQGKETIRTAVDASLKNSAYKAGGNIPSWVAEGLSEVATGISNDIADKIYVDPNIQIGNHAFDDMVVGAVMGKVFDAPNSIVSSLDRKAQKDITKKVLKSVPTDMPYESYMNLIELMSEREALVQMENNLSEEFKGKYQARIIQLTDEATSIIQNEYSDYKKRSGLEVGEMEADSNMQEKIDYLNKRDVTIPYGTTSEELTRLYETEKQKQEGKLTKTANIPTEKTEKVPISGQEGAVSQPETISQKEKSSQKEKPSAEGGEQKIQEKKFENEIEEKYNRNGKSLNRVEYVPIAEIDKFKEHDRETQPKFNKKELDDLTEQIKKDGGIKTPITLTIDKNGNALVTEGNTRLAAAKRLGLTKIPVKINNVDSFGSINKDKAQKLEYSSGESNFKVDKEYNMPVTSPMSYGFNSEKLTKQGGTKNDTENITGVSGKKRVGEESKQAEPQQVTGKTETETGGMVQTSQIETKDTVLSKVKKSLEEHGFLYHGTSNKKISDLILPPSKTKVISEKSRKKNLDKVFFSKSAKSANIYAGRAFNEYGGEKKTHRVIPIGDIEVLNAKKGTEVLMSDMAIVIPDNIKTIDEAIKYAESKLTPDVLKELNKKQDEKLNEQRNVRDDGNGRTVQEGEMQQQQVSAESLRGAEQKNENVIVSEEGKKISGETQKTVSEKVTPDTSIKDKSKLLANSLRKAKFVQSMSDLNKLQSDPTGLLKVAWDGSIEAAAKIIEVSGSIAQAVSNGVSTLKQSDWYKSLSKQAKTIAEKRLKEDIKSVYESSRNEIKKVHEDFLKESIGEKRVDDIKKSLRSIAEEMMSFDNIKLRNLSKSLTNYLKDTKGLSSEEKNLLIKEVVSEFKTGKKETGSTSLGKKIKTLLTAVQASKKDTEKNFKEASAKIIDEIKNAKGNKSITAGQYRSIINKLGSMTTDVRTKFGEKLPSRLKKLMEYVDKVLVEANYNDQLASAKKTIKEVIKKNKDKNSIFGTAKKLADAFANIDPSELTYEELVDFNEAATKILTNTKTPTISYLEGLVAKYGDRTREEYDSFAEKIDKAVADGTIDKLSESLIKELDDYISEANKLFNNLESARDYIKASRKIAVARKKVDKLFNAGVLTDEEVSNYNKMFGDKDAFTDKDMEDYEKKFGKRENIENEWETLLADFKKEYAQKIKEKQKEIKSQLKNLSQQEQETLKDIFNVSAEQLEKLNIVDLETIDIAIENIKDGYVTPSVYEVGLKLDSIRDRESYVNDVFKNIFNSRRWGGLIKRGFTNRATRIFQETTKEKPTGVNLEESLGSTKSHRWDVLLGNSSKYKTLNNLMMKLVNGVQKESNEKRKFEDKRLKILDDFIKNYKGKAADKIKEIGNFLIERSWQQEDFFQEGKVNEDTGSYNQARFFGTNRLFKAINDGSAFNREQIRWANMFKEAQEKGLTKKVNGVEVLDVEKYEQYLRKDKAVSKLLDDYTNYMEEVKPYAEVATMQNGRSFISKLMYYPFRSKESGREVSINGIINEIRGINGNVKMQANSTFNRTGVIQWLENDIIKVMGDHTNEVLRNYYVYPKIKSVMQSVRGSVEDYIKENNPKNREEANQLKEALMNAIKNRVARYYNSGKYSSSYDPIFDRWMKGAKKGMLVNFARIPPELLANAIRGAWMMGTIPLSVIKMSKSKKAVYDSLFSDYINDKYWSKYSPEIGGVSKTKAWLNTLEKWADKVIIVSDKAIGRPLMIHEFNRAFKDITKKDFDPEKLKTDENYYYKNKDAIERATTWAIRRLEEGFNDKTSLTSPELIKFVGGVLKLDPYSPKVFEKTGAKVFDVLMSFNRNEVEQLIDSSRRIRQGKIDNDYSMVRMGMRDIIAISTSNAVYQTARRISGVFFTNMFASMMGQALTGYEEDDKEKLMSSEELWRDFRRSAEGFMMGGSANVYSWTSRWLMFAIDGTKILSEEQKNVIYDIMLNDLYSQKIPDFGSPKTVLSSALPLPNVAVKDVFKGIEGLEAISNALAEAESLGEITTEQWLQLASIANLGAKYFAPNILSPTLQKNIDRGIKNAKDKPKGDTNRLPTFGEKGAMSNNGISKKRLPKF